MKVFPAFTVLIIFIINCSITYSYKKDHGFGYLFKHDPNMKQREKAEKLTSDRIRAALGGIGNGTLFANPFSMRDVQTKFSGTTMYFRGMRIYGLDRFRPLQIRSDFTNLAVSLTLSMDQLNILGDFEMTPWVVKGPGTFNFTIHDAWLSFEAEIVFSNEGTPEEGLETGDILQSQLTYDELELNFENLGFLSTVLQPVRKSLARYIFSQVKPTLCSQGEENFRKVLNKVLMHLPKEYPNAVNVVDRALIRARASMKSSQLDPLYIPDHYPKSNKLFKLELTQGKLFGLSSIKRVGPILVGFERDAVHMLLNLGVTDLKGEYAWTFILWRDLLSNRGVIHFKVQDVAIKVKLEKRLNSQENSTRVENIEMKIGSVNLLSEGIGAVKYIMETFMNVVPDTFRQRITDAAEYRLLKVIQEEVQKIDLEELVEDDSSVSLEGA